MTADTDFSFTSWNEVQQEANDPEEIEGVEFTSWIPGVGMQQPEERKQKKELESSLKQIGRTLYQIPAGRAKAFTYLMDILQMVASGYARHPLTIREIEDTAREAGVPFNKEAYLKAVEDAESKIPTQENIERFVEEKTGLPLTPKTELQKNIRFGSEAAGFTPGGIVKKVTAAIAAPIAEKGLEKIGVPESIAKPAALIGSTAGAQAIPKGSPKIKAKTKPSGLPVRRYEKVSDLRKVSLKRHGKIQEKLETDFKKISDKIISESPISKTKATLEDNPAFKVEVADQFRKVEKLAEGIPETLNTQTVKKKLVDNALKKKGTGFAPSEYDNDYRKFITQFLKETPNQEIKASDLVAQYRKNNKALSEAYDPSRSYAFNRAKKDALLEYNRAIADVMESEFPNTEFVDLFKETNKSWADISDAEAIDKFTQGIFEGKIDYNKAKKFFLNKNQARPFKQALGKDNFKKYEQLMKDMLSTEKPFKMLKIAKQKGFEDLVKTAGAYIIHPKLGKAKLAFGAGKNLYRNITNALLDKPQIISTWENGIKSLKNGDFKKAEKEFSKLDKDVKSIKKQPQKKIGVEERKKIEV